jgi:hypothetical protein
MTQPHALQRITRSTALTPLSFFQILLTGDSFVDRIRAAPRNASRMSHPDLNEAPALDAGLS